MVKKQAVLLIHGIGDQKPLETLRKFVTAVWTRNGRVHNEYTGSHYWSKPDDISESFELRKFTTPQNHSRVSTDFFELYWAHLMEGTTYGHVVAWLKTLMLRRPGTLSAQLKPVYWFLWAATLLASNRPVDDWGKLLGDTAAVTALLDRLLHHAHVLKCGPRSWRTKVQTDLRSEPPTK